MVAPATPAGGHGSDGGTTPADSPGSTAKLQQDRPGQTLRASVANLNIAPQVAWLWNHRSGFREYDDDARRMIEKAYRGGQLKVRLKTGKDGKTPKEVWFKDMVQYDPSSKNRRDVRREGPLTCWDRMERFLNSLNRMLETGMPRNQTLEEYIEIQEQLHTEVQKDMCIDFDVEDIWQEKGIAASCARSQSFFGLSMFVVILNTIWIAIDLDRNDEEFIIFSAVEFQVKEYLFISYFLIELVIKFVALKEKSMIYRDRWLAFDFFLVFLMLFETFFLPFMYQEFLKDHVPAYFFKGVSALRMLRLLRLVKGMRMVPQLFCLVQGVIQAIEPMFYTAVLLLILVYVGSIVFRSQAKGVVATMDPSVSELFASVTESMYSLALFGVLLDGPAAVVMALWQDVGPTTAMLFLVFIFLSAFTVLNMLIGILCEVVSRVSQEEMEKAEVRFLRNNLLEVLKCYDRDNSNSIGKIEFDMFVRNPELHDCLARFGTKVEDFKLLKDVLFDDTDIISFNLILQTVMRLKGDNLAKVTDIIELREYMRQRTKELSHGRDAILDRLDVVLQGQDRLAGELESCQDRIDRIRRSKQGSS